MAPESPFRFTIDELRRIQRTLAERLEAARRRDVLDIGFGPGMRGGRLDPERPWCICVYVRRKVRRPARPVPRQVDFRLRRGRRFDRFTVATDVVAAGRPQLTGTPLAAGVATGGGLVAWKGKRGKGRSWAILTVGHAFPVPRGSQVDVGALRPPAIGRLIARSSASGVDAALVVVDRFDLVRVGLLAPGQQARRQAVRELDAWVASQGHQGATRPRQVDIPFQVRAYLPRTRLFARQVGILRHVVHAYRALEGTFAPGTSGALWTLDGRPAGLQFGGEAPDFREGYAQALEEVLEWAQQAVEEWEDDAIQGFGLVARL